MEQRNSSHIIVIVCIVGWQEDGRVAASVAKIPQCQTCSMLVHILSICHHLCPWGGDSSHSVIHHCFSCFLWLDHLLFHVSGCISCSSPFSDVYLSPSIVTVQPSIIQSRSITHTCHSMQLSQHSCSCLALASRCHGLAIVSCVFTRPHRWEDHLHRRCAFWALGKPQIIGRPWYTVHHG